MTELWIVYENARSVGFFYALWPPTIEVSSISRELADRKYRSVATISNAHSQILTRDDCAISIEQHATEESDPFIGGWVAAQLSKRKLIQRMVVANLLLLVAITLLVLAILVSALLAFVFYGLGFQDIGAWLGTTLIPILIAITIMCIVLFVPLLIVMFAITHPANKVVSSFQIDLEEITRNLVPEITIREFQIKKEPKAEKLEETVSQKIDVIRDKFEDDSINKIIEYIG